MNLAEYIIEANEQEHSRANNDTAPEGYYTDDMGYWVEQDIRKDREKFAKYILYRCLRRHDDIYKWRGDLYSGHTILSPTTQCIIRLADVCDMITPAQAIWVYNRLMDIAAELDETKIRVSNDMYWDIEKSELRSITDDTRG